MSPPRDRSQKNFPPPIGIPGAERSSLAQAAAAGSRDVQQELREKYQQALQMVWRKPDNCPICDSTAWNIADLIEVPVREVGATFAAIGVQTRRAYVYAPVTCLYCGYTIFFHTGVLDVRLTEETKAVPPLHLQKDEP